MVIITSYNSCILGGMFCSLNSVNLSAVKWWCTYLPECDKRIVMSELLTVFMRKMFRNPYLCRAVRLIFSAFM